MMDIKELAEQFGLPVIERGNILYIVGEEQILEFNILLGFKEFKSEEKVEWQLKKV